MLDQYSGTLLISTLLIVAPILVGIPIALFGSGRAVWVAAVMALALTLAGLRYATAIYTPRYDGVGQVLFGLLLSALGLVLGLGTCTVALIHSARDHRWAWAVMLLVIAALPLLAALPIFDLNVLEIGPAHPGGPGFDQVLDLALLLPPIGCAVLVAFGVWSAPRRWPDPDVAPDEASASS